MLSNPLPTPPTSLDQMPDDMLGMIFKNFSAQDLRNVERVSRRFHQLVADFRLWERLLQNNPNIRNLDLQSEVLIRYGFTPLQATASPRILALAADVACIASEDGMATILTLPAGWSLEQLERVSQAAVVAGITSADINFLQQAYRASLTPLQEEQTIVLTNTVIHGSRNNTSQVLAALLESKGFEPRFPDALIVLTMTVFTHIMTQGHLSLYHTNDQKKWSYTRCQQKTHFGSYLMVAGRALAFVSVANDHCFDLVHVGVGGQLKFVRGVRT